MREWSQVGKGIDKPESRQSHEAIAQRMLAFPRSHVAVNDQTEKCSDIPTNVVLMFFNGVSFVWLVKLLRSLCSGHCATFTQSDNKDPSEYKVTNKLL